MNPSESPRNAASPWPAGLLLLSIHCLAIGAAALAMWVVVPKFVHIFNEFELKLPASTLLLINISNYFQVWGWLLLPIFLVVDAALLILPRSGGREGILLSKLWFGCVLLCLGLLMALIVVGLMQPMLVLQAGLSGP